MNPFRYDFGYDWAFAYGHLVPLAVGLLALIVALRINRSPWITGIAALVTLWSLAGLAIVQFALRANLPLELPTQQFLRNGAARVLDVGAGSGRASLMVLLERPQAHVVALDIFDNRFGITDNTARRLRANAAIAGVDERLEVAAGDMREMSLPSASFDAAVTAYAIDHMRRSDSVRALRELHRVLRSDGELLVEVMHTDAYVHMAFPVLGSHGMFGPGDAEARWRALVREASFDVLESGTLPGTVYVLARKREADSISTGT